MQKLKDMHPSTISEFSTNDGPAAWLLLIPTSTSLMEKFLKGNITERELFDMTPAGIHYEAIYLCSALVLEEFRRLGIIHNMAWPCEG
ncbi:MAG: hypothetical protein ABIJ16_03500 [Bacteroidota bacterium]